MEQKQSSHLLSSVISMTMTIILIFAAWIVWRGNNDISIFVQISLLLASIGLIMQCISLLFQGMARKRLFIVSTVTIFLALAGLLLGML